MKNFTKKILVSGVWILFGVTALGLGQASAATMQITATTSANTNISTQDQQLVDMIKMKIDALSLEKTETVWNRRVQVKAKIPMTHSQYRIIEWLDDYLQWSVADKKEKMMMEMMDDMMDKDMMMPGDTMGGNTIADLAMNNSDLNMLVDIVVHVGLADALKADGNRTVFAPTNKAFEEALEMLGMTANELMQEKELLKQIILHHVVDMKVTAETAMSLEYGTLVETLSGETIRVRTGEGVWVDNAMVINADMMASNGVVHVIDKVLLPPSFQESNGMTTDRGTMNIAEIAMGDNMFSTLVSGVKAADLADMLMDDGPYTVFAPTNEAFVKLLQENNMNIQQLLTDKDMLASVISYHVVSGFYTSSDIMGMDTNAMRETANGASLDIDPMGKVNGTTIIKADIFATNGVIHVIDEVLMP